MTSSRRSSRLAAALLASLLFVAAACGTDGKADDAAKKPTTTTAAPSTTTTEAAEPTDGTDHADGHETDVTEPADDPDDDVAEPTDDAEAELLSEADAQAAVESVNLTIDDLPAGEGWTSEPDDGADDNVFDTCAGEALDLDEHTIAKARGEELTNELEDTAPLVADLDEGLCAEPRLASLPTRFLFVVDDGRGDVSVRPFDLGYRAVDHDHGWLLLGAADLGISVPASHAADMLLALAREFLAASWQSGDVWHVRELRSWSTSVPGVRTINLPLERTDVPLGAVGGAASVQVPLGSLTPAQAATIEAASATGRVVITPSRGLVLPGAAARLPELVAAGFIDDASSPWSAISACVGAPSCQKSLIDTRAYAMRLAEFGHALPRTHISGCERRCGAPAGAHHDLVAPTAASPLVLVGESR